MKRSTTKMLIATFLMSGFILTGCAEENHMGMENIDKHTVESEMKKDTMMVEGHTEMSHKKMANEMKETTQTEKEQEMHSMADGMEKTPINDTNKME